jgi:hypothetical protein
MNSAEFAHSSFYDALAVRGLGHIHVLKESVAPAFNDLPGNRLSGLVDVGYGNRGTFAGEQQGCGASNA